MTKKKPEPLTATEVDVNEQNINAVKFCSKIGFRSYDRTEKDQEGGIMRLGKMSEVTN